MFIRRIIKHSVTIISICILMITIWYTSSVGVIIAFLPQGGDTPLHWASGGGHSNTARMLLELGAKIHSTNHAKCFFFFFYFFIFFLIIVIIIIFNFFVINKTDIWMMITTNAYFIRRYTRCHDILSRSEGTCLLLLIKEAQTLGD